MAEDRRPLLAWLGAPPAAALQASLEREVRLHVGWTEGAVLVAAWAPSGPEILEGLPAGHPDVLAVSEGAPRVRDRLAWIRAGAADLVSQRDLRLTLNRKLRLLPEPTVEPPPAAEPTPPKATSPAPAPEPPPAAPEPPAPALLPAATKGPFPPLLLPTADPLDQAERALNQLERYIQRRRALAAKLGPGGEQALIALLHQRDLIGRGGPPDPYGQRSGGAPGWQVGLRAANDPSESAATSFGELIGLGRDALTLRLNTPRTPRERLVLDISLGPRGHAQLLIQCRWQRRVAARLWTLGALILKVRRRKDLDEPAGSSPAR